METIENKINENEERIERNIQNITGDDRLTLEDVMTSRNDTHILTFCGKKDYAARDWDLSTDKIKSYFEGFFPTHDVEVEETPEDTEREWYTSVRLKRK